MWLPPDASYASHVRMFRAGVFALPFTIGPRFVVRVLVYLQHLDRLRHDHTPFRHWYLQLLGSDPAHQRKGYATAMLASMLARLDSEGLPCCLETMKSDNVAFYERFGFRVVAKSTIPKSDVDLWLMARGA